MRHRTVVYILFTILGLIANLIAGAALMADGGAVLSALTGLNIWALNIHLRLPLHCYIVCLYLHVIFEIYAVNPVFGSPDKLYELLKTTQVNEPAASEDGSYLTIKRHDGLVKAVTILLGGFSNISPETAVKGYVLGSVAWYAIPFRMSTAYLFIVLVFMAVTSTVSSESIVTSSLMTFDIYKTFINPQASTKALLHIFIAGLVVYAAALSAISCIFHAAGISLNYLISLMACDCVSLGMRLVCITLFSYLVPDKTRVVAVIEGQAIEARRDEEIHEKAKMDNTETACPTSMMPDPNTLALSKPSSALALKPLLFEPPVPICAQSPAQVGSQKRLALIALIAAFVWAFSSFVICVVLPLWESCGEVWYIVGAIWRDVRRERVHRAEVRRVTGGLVWRYICLHALSQ
ncbi:hypothetical protein K505DRAFT_348102 [Melanomma pulvis-pyrius CBS 109.77]|uniref:Uncharacterized protein n=1 Tax=Melanomma pulvis-pyrius CBS 109.77 TaxID=1314802 RepID=A0A6A6XIA7_9PLEO|nr:hypothetical protein K505DRAFT_348102 [Melanomma pulvis-pyrius CBS 109.77]